MATTLTREDARLVAEELAALNAEAQGKAKEDGDDELPIGEIKASEFDMRLARWVRKQGRELIKCKTRDQRRNLLQYMGDTMDGMVGIEKAATSLENGDKRRTQRVDRQLNTPYNAAFNALQAVFGD